MRIHNAASKEEGRTTHSRYSGLLPQSKDTLIRHRNKNGQDAAWWLASKSLYFTFGLSKTTTTGTQGGLTENKDMFSPEHRIWRELSLVDDSELSVGVNVNAPICLYTVYQPCDIKKQLRWNRLPPHPILWQPIVQDKWWMKMDGWMDQVLSSQCAVQQQLAFTQAF